MSTSKSVDPLNPPSAYVDEEFVEVVAPVDIQEMDRSSTEVPQHEPDVMVGACIAGACLGCLIGGPALGCIAGAGSAYGTTRNNAAGDCTRSMGQLALSCRSKAIQVNEKHQIVEKTKTAAYVCWQKSRDMNERHRMAERTKDCLVAGWEGAKEANRKYHIIDRTFEAIGVTCAYLSDKIAGDAGANVTTTTVEAATAAVAQQQNNEGESYAPGRNDQKKGSYALVKTSDI